MGSIPEQDPGFSMRSGRLLAIGLLVALVVSGGRAAESHNVEAEEAREQCLARCNKLEVNCSSSVREASRECSRQAATPGRDPIGYGYDRGSAFCAYFQGDRCIGGLNGANCRSRYRHRYINCLDAYRGDIASQYLDCGDAERNAVVMCRSELRDCETEC